MTYPRETLKQAGYRHRGFATDRDVAGGYDGKAAMLHILEDVETGNLEAWAACKHYAGYAIIYKNTHLEFVRTANKEDLRKAGISQ